jgi:hypothetical protein
VENLIFPERFSEPLDVKIFQPAYERPKQSTYLGETILLRLEPHVAYAHQTRWVFLSGVFSTDVAMLDGEVEFYFRRTI